MRRQHRNALLPPSCLLPHLQRTLLSTGTLHAVQAQQRPSSLEIHGCLLRRIPCPRLLPECRGPPSVVRVQAPPITFRLHGFSPPCRFSPRSKPRAYCISHPTMKFGAFPTSESRHAEASRGIVVFPAPLPPLEEFPLNRPYRITAAIPYLALHQIGPRLSEDTRGTASFLTTLPRCTNTVGNSTPACR
jgi:hypothetical protein